MACGVYSERSGLKDVSALKSPQAGALSRHAIQIVLAFMNSRMPAAPSSRPKPERFTPPNGNRGSDADIALMKTIPDSNSDANSSCSVGSLVQALAAKP